MAKAFVIILHTGWGEDHYDLMLESGEMLATWQLGQNCLDLGPGESEAARKLPDHRRAYLTYEGPVSRQRGHVRRVSSGEYETLEADAARLVVRLSGPAGLAEFELARTDAAGDEWTLTRL